MDPSSYPEFIRFLLCNCSYPHRPARVELVQTHISYVILAGDLVYKWKKPVRFGFLDFSTLALRKYFCEEEIRLNRRLCPEMYLGVAVVSRDERGFRLDSSGEPVEFGVKMSRLPEDRMMNRVIAAAELDKGHIERVVQVLLPFYAALEPLRGSGAYGSATAVRKIIYDNFTETRRFVGSDALSLERFSRIRRFAENFLGNADLFQYRVDTGHVKECHGDLHSANICLIDPVAIFDCIEFNKNLRCTDVAADVAFLAMDLDFNGLSGLSDFFIHRFIEETGDDELEAVLNFYKCYRAYVRGKIGLLTAADPGVDRTSAARSLADAERYFRLADTYGDG
jgi:hypothetical protein